VTKLPQDVPKRKVIKTLEALGSALMREGNHISMRRINPDGGHTSLTLPNHKVIKGSTLLLILRQAGITRDEFLEAFDE
jgi:predicted RNA binding protein YcfA (HicA-like mRNA interferase family)